MRRQAHRFFLLMLLIMSGSAAQAGPWQNEGPIVLAVHPYISFTELLKRYQPLADYLKDSLGSEVVVRIGRDYREHISFIGKDKVDIAYLGPAQYVRMVDKYGNKPLLARLEIKGAPVFHGYLVTHRSSGVMDIESLRGRRFAFGDPASTMSHLVPRYMLLEAGIKAEDLRDYQFLGSHKNVALGVLAGAFDAGAVKEEIFELYKDRGLRAFAKSPPFSEHLFVARSDAPTDFVQRVRAALYRLSDTPEGREILNGIKQGTTAMAPVTDTDYDNLRAVLKQLSEHGIE